MNTEEPKCGDNCTLVEMLATKTSKEQAMKNAVAAVLTGNISQRGAAKQFGVKQQTLSDRLKKATGAVTESGHDATPSETAPVKPRVADAAERDQWFADHQAGLSARKISEKYGRNRRSITAEIKRREEPEVEQQPSPAPTVSAPPAPAPAPEPELSVPSVGSSAPARWEDDPVLDGWNGNLNELGQQIYNREVASSRKRMQMVEQMAEFKLLLEKTMRAASKSHTVKAGRLLEADVKMVEATLQREGRPGIKQSLEAVLKEAERIQKYASETLRLLQLQEAHNA